MAEKDFFDEAWDTVTDFLGKTVPLAANLYAPGAGGIVSLILSTIFGVDANDPQAIAGAIENATPQQIIDLKKMVLKSQVDLEKLNLDDVKDARRASTARVRATGRVDWFRNLLSVFYTISFPAIAVFALTQNLTGTKEKILYMFIGYFGSAYTAVQTFYLGSSKSSGEKNNILARKNK